MLYELYDDFRRFSVKKIPFHFCKKYIEEERKEEGKTDHLLLPESYKNLGFV